MFKKLYLFLNSYLFEGLLLLVIIGFFFVQHLDVVFMSVALFVYFFLVLLLNSAFLSTTGIKRGMLFLRQYPLEAFLLFAAAVFLFIQRLDLVFSSAILFSCVFLVLFLNDTFLSRGIKGGIKDIKKEYLYSVLILIFAVLLFIWQFNFEAITFLTLSLFFVLYAWDSRVVAGAALAFLASDPILLIYKKDNFAEQMAIYAYYFLITAVVLQIVEYWRESRKSKRLSLIE